MNNTPQNNSSRQAQKDESIIVNTLLFLFKYIKIAYNYIYTLATNELTIQQCHQNFKLGILSPENQSKYISAVLQNRRIVANSKSLSKNYVKYLQPNNSSSTLTVDQILDAIKNPNNYVLYSKNQLQGIIDQKIKSEVPDLVEREKQNLIDALLPFTTNESEYVKEQIGLFERQDFQRLKLYTQMQKGKELDERELVSKYKDLEHQSKEQFLDAKNEKLEVRNEKLEVKNERLDVKNEKLEVKEMQLENARILLQIEGRKQEVEYKIKFLELSNLSMELQHTQTDMKHQEKEFEVLQLLHDYEMKNRALNLTHGQQMLSLNQQGLENELQLKEADFLHKLTQQENLKIKIDNQLLDLKDGQFTQKAKETFLDIKKQRITLQQDEFRLENNTAIQEAKMMREKAYVEKQEAKLSEQQSKMYHNLNKLEYNNQFLRSEKSQLLRELSAKPKTIYI